MPNRDDGVVVKVRRRRPRMLNTQTGWSYHGRTLPLNTPKRVELPLSNPAARNQEPMGLLEQPQTERHSHRTQVTRDMDAACRQIHAAIFVRMVTQEHTSCCVDEFGAFIILKTLGQAAILGLSVNNMRMNIRCMAQWEGLNKVTVIINHDQIIFETRSAQHKRRPYIALKKQKKQKHGKWN